MRNLILALALLTSAAAARAAHAAPSTPIGTVVLAHGHMYIWNGWQWVMIG